MEMKTKLKCKCGIVHDLKPQLEEYKKMLIQEIEERLTKLEEKGK
jgi:hypothetical protein